MTAPNLPTPKPPFLTEEELHEWLASEDWYPSAHTKAWLERTPRKEAADVLAHFAAQADLEPLNPFALALMVGVTAGFVPSQGAAGRGVLNRKAGIRAALYLADFGDIRAIAPLCRLWTNVRVKRSKYYQQIEPALIRLLSENEGCAAPGETRDAVRHLVSRIWQAGGPKRDLSRAQADLLITARLFLAEDCSFLPDAPLSLLPNRARVQETARETAKQIPDERW